MKTGNLFENIRMKLPEAIELTAQNMTAHAGNYKHSAIAFSGGKDSATTLTVIVWLIESGSIPEPETLTVFYADTRLELTPLYFSALKILDALRERDIKVEIVLPALDDRYFVYMFGRGVPPPSNTFRWCTPQLKVEPMELAQERLACELGGELAANQQRMGPLTKDARRYGLSIVLEIQHEVNQVASAISQPEISLINAEEEARIFELIEADTWPDGWSGTESRADVMLDKVFNDGTGQPLLGFEQL
jgi:DNA sulfur modification protein DndC